ncbi:MAG: ABC transporter substrate-binding protein [Nitrososphaerales archaeon]
MSVSRRKFVGGVIGGLIAGAVGGYAASTILMPSEEEVKREPELPNPIRIGVALGLSGSMASVLAGMYEGIELAVKLCNEQGGIKGRKVELLVEDSQSDPNKALEAVKKLVEVNGVKVIIGLPVSVEVLSVASYVNTKEVLLMSTRASAPALSELGDDYIFRGVASDELTYKGLAEWAKFNGFSRIATFVRADDWGIGFEKGLEKELPGKIVARVRADLSRGDFRAELELVKQAKPDAILWAIFVNDAKVILKQALEVGLVDIPSFGDTPLDVPAVLEDPALASYFIRSKWTEYSVVIPKKSYNYQLFARQFYEAFGKQPPTFAELGFDTTNLTLLAIADAGVYDPKAIKKSVLKISQHYIGPSGHKAYDSNGDIILQEYQIMTVKEKNGKPEWTEIGKWNLNDGVVLY